MKKSVTTIVILAMLFSMLICGCDFRHKERIEYHEGVEDLERYILDELGDYIWVVNFEKDVPQVPPQQYEPGVAVMNIAFRTRYIYYKSETSRITPIQVIEQVRDLYNQYVSDCSNYNLSGYLVRIRFSVPIDYTPPYEEYAILSNEDYETAKITGDKLTTISLYEPKYMITDYSYPFGQWDELYHITDLEIAELDNYATMDRIIEVADNMPFLKYIVVKDQQTADQASTLRPNVKFVSLSGG